MLGLAVGIVIGLVLGLTGAGGSLFAVPMLAVLLGLPPVEATGVALGAVALSALMGVIQRRGVGIVWLPVSIILTGGVAIAPVGRWLAGFIPDLYLLLGFSLLTSWTALRMWLQASKSEVGLFAEVLDEDLTVKPEPLLMNGFWPTPILWKSIVAGLVTGLLSGLLGVGGGFVIIPILTLLVGLTMAQAIASSLLIIAFVSTSGFVAHWWLHHGIAVDILIWVSLGGVVGMWLGGLLSPKIGGSNLQRGFALMLVVTTALMWRINS